VFFSLARILFLLSLSLSASRSFSTFLFLFFSPLLLFFFGDHGGVFCDGAVGVASAASQPEVFPLHLLFFFF
jgi:hypothetical protein